MIICMMLLYSTGVYYCFSCAAKRAATQNDKFRFVILYGQFASCVQCGNSIDPAEVEL